MKSHWKQYLALGINHHLLFPASLDSCLVHQETLPGVLGFSEFEVVDMFIPQAGSVGQQEIAWVRESGKQIVYNCPLMVSDERNPHSLHDTVRRSTLAEVALHLDRARKLGAKKVVVASGLDPGPDQREQQTQYFVEYLCELCRVATLETDILIEPFDRSIGKNLLLGPSVEAAAVIEKVQQRGHNNIGVLVDMGHIPLMEESFSHAVHTVASHIKHVHLGSCVMQNAEDPLYGDMHPPWGHKGGENDVPELVEFLRCLFQARYLAEGKRPTVTLEMRPYPHMTEVQSLERFIAKLDEAWAQLPEPKGMF